MIEHRKNATHKKFESSFSKWSRRFFKHFLSSPWFSNNKNQSSFDDIIFPALLFFSGASTVLWEETLLEKDPSNKLRLIALIYGLQIFSFLLLRPILRSILRIGLSFSFLKYILFAVFTSITFLISFEEFWSLAFFGGIVTFAVALFLSAETSFVIYKQKLALHFHYVSLIPLSMGLIFFGNVISNIVLNGNLNYLSYLVYGILLIILYRINSKTSNAPSFTNRPAPDITPEPLEQKPFLLKEVDLAKVEEKLNSFIAEKIYRNSNWRLPHLATYLGISLHQTSYYLNRHKGMGFNDFINRLRIQEALRLLSNLYPNISLIELSIASGFRNYTTFHRAFKKETGIVPREFLKGLNASLTLHRHLLLN